MTKFDSIWDAISETPAEAESMKLRSGLMMALKDHIVAKALNRPEAAKLFGVTQSRIADLMRGKIDLFSLDTLVTMAVVAGMRVKINIEKAT